MNLGGRVKLARKARGLKQEQLVALVPGLSQANLSALEKRDSVKSKFAPRLAEVLHVNPRWLQTGEPADQSGLDEPWRPVDQLREDEARLLELYNRLPRDARPAIHEVCATTLALMDRVGVGQTRTRSSG